MSAPREILRFGPFEAEPDTGELRKHGIRVKLAAQSFEVLMLLAEKTGELVTREDIRLALWPHETVVEWEHSINTAIKRIRAVLGDSAGTPRYVETLPRRGYRFLALVERVRIDSARDAPDASQRESSHTSAPYTDPLGQTISHYRVLALLGSGGMGVVYRGEDTALERPVALKFLQPALEGNPSAVERFQREARAASSLNHPNICTVYEVEVFRGRAFLAMELLEGETLRERIARAVAQKAETPLLTSSFSLTMLLDLGVQVALALEAAHDRGIIHRDIKPANVFLVRGEIVKVLDFGLAKAAPRRLPDGSTPGASPSFGSDPLTSTGVTPGTIAYMSPEQKRGEELDARTDLYSFGTVLYEAATLERAPEHFHPASLPPSVAGRHPAKFWEIIARLLDPDRAMRYQTAGDVASDLRRLKRDISSSTHVSIEPAVIVRPRRTARFVAIALVLVVPVITGAFYLFSRYRPEPALGPVLVQPLTGMSALEDDPAFAPDGTRVAYSVETGPGYVAHIYLKLIGGGPPLALTADPAYDTSPAWSPDGKVVAFLRRGDGSPKVCLIPALGGSVRCPASIGAAAPDRGSRALSWLPDGNGLLVSDRLAGERPAAIYHLNLGTGEKVRLTSPPPDAEGDGSPSVAPDGTRFAFIRWIRDSVSDLYVEPLAGGAALRVTQDNKRLNELAWTADSRSIVLSTQRGGLPGLWRVPSGGGSLRPLSGVGEDAAAPAISRQANLAAYVYQFENVNLWRLPLTDAGVSPRKPFLFIQSPRHDVSAIYSPDGKRIAFSSDRSGSFEIWTADGDGSHPQQLTFFKGPNTGTPHWSPDGKWIVFDSRPGGHVAIFIIGSDGGQPRQITDGNFDDLVPFWSHDGKWIYFCSSRSGERQIWRITPSGLDASQVTRNGGFDSMESPDGKWIVFSKPLGGIWRAPVTGGVEEQLVSVATSRFWTISRDDLIYLDLQVKPKPAFTAMDLGSRRTRRLGNIAGDVAWGYSGTSVSPDGQWLLYPEIDRLVSQINLIENFR